MSSKSRMKHKPITLTRAPRSMEELTKLASELTWQYGNAVYQSSVYQNEADKLYESLEAINQEGAQRRELDQKTASNTQEETRAVSEGTVRVPEELK